MRFLLGFTLGGVFGLASHAKHHFKDLPERVPGQRNPNPAKRIKLPKPIVQDAELVKLG